MKPKLILFDFSGTLAYLKKISLKKIFSFLKSFGIDFKEDKKSFFLFCSKNLALAKNWFDFIKKLGNFYKKNLKKSEIKELANFFQKNIVYKLYKDVKEIKKLPLKKAILTNNGRFLFKNLKLEKIAKVFTPKETKFFKPDKRAFLYLLKKLKVRPQETIMVGDEIEKDLIPAKKLGMKVVLIDRKNKIKNSPFRKIRSLKELKNFIEGL